MNMYFSEKKFEKLSNRNKAEKVACLLWEADIHLLDCTTEAVLDATDFTHLFNLLRIAGGECKRKELFYMLIECARKAISKKSSINETSRAFKNLRYFFLSEAGKEIADWDFSSVSTDGADKRERKILPINVYLDDLRSPFNVGSIFRTAESFCFQNLFLSPASPTPAHKRAVRSAMGTAELIDWKVSQVEELPRPLFALETGGSPIEEFDFSQCGTVIIGSEECGISQKALEACRKDKGVVSIPLYGIKGSINVGVAFGILAHRWVSFFN